MKIFFLLVRVCVRARVQWSFNPYTREILLFLFLFFQMDDMQLVVLYFIQSMDLVPSQSLGHTYTGRW